MTRSVLSGSPYLIECVRKSRTDRNKEQKLFLVFSTQTTERRKENDANARNRESIRFSRNQFSLSLQLRFTFISYMIASEEDKKKQHHHGVLKLSAVTWLHCSLDCRLESVRRSRQLFWCSSVCLSTTCFEDHDWSISHLGLDRIWLAPKLSFSWFFVHHLGDFGV